MADQDIDFDMESTVRSTRKSRRPRRDPMEDDNLDSILDSVSKSFSQPQPQPRKASIKREEQQLDDLNDTQFGNNFSATKQPGKAVGGWGEDELNTIKLPQEKSNRRELAIEINKELEIPNNKSFGRISQREINKDTSEIPEIPDLEEEVDAAEDMAFQVAEAPDVQVHQISTYKELDKEFFKEKAFQFLEGNIDVSLLHCGLYTEQQIAEEEDVIWEWNKLFTDVVSAVSRTTEFEASDELNQTSLIDTIRVRADPNIMKAKREKEILF